MDEDAYGVGTIIRDSRRRFVATWVKFFQGSSEAKRAESMAVLQGLNLAKEMGIKAVMFGGCKNSVGWVP